MTPTRKKLVFTYFQFKTSAESEKKSVFSGFVSSTPYQSVIHWQYNTQEIVSHELHFFCIGRHNRMMKTSKKKLLAINSVWATGTPLKNEFLLFYRENRVFIFIIQSFAHDCSLSLSFDFFFFFLLLSVWIGSYFFFSNLPLFTLVYHSSNIM